MKNILFLFMGLGLLACQAETKKKVAEKLLEATEKDFAGKEEARAEIEQLFADYKSTFDYDSTSFDRRMELMSERYFQRFSTLIQHALTSNKRAVEGLLLSEQIAILGLRKEFDKNDLTSMSTKEVMRALDKGAMYLGLKDSSMENLIFLTDKEALAGQKSAFSIQPLSFFKEGTSWKLDPLGDPTAQRMKENQIIKASGQSKQEYLNQMLTSLGYDLEEAFVPLNKR
jgi:hypothetical protein